jgi:hypothetical protein
MFGMFIRVLKRNVSRHMLIGFVSQFLLFKFKNVDLCNMSLYSLTFLPGGKCVK